MEGIRRESASARALAAALKDERFTLIDVGCSGGIDEGWKVFGDRLSAYGFDPGQFEIERLRQAETRPEVHYINAFVGLPFGHPLRLSSVHEWRANPWARLSTYRTSALQQARESGTEPPEPPALYRPTPEQLEHEAAHWVEFRNQPPADPAPRADQAGDQADLMSRNRWQEAELADETRPVHLPDFFDKEGVTDIDFIKIDVDGPDFDILRSLTDDMNRRQVLGAVLEVNYIGSSREHAHTFHNTDRFMRSLGFDLLDLSVRRYSLSALPLPYSFDPPFGAQNDRGRPIQGDALYMRDFGYPSNGPDPKDWPDEKLIKQAALYCLFGLLDHAAEILVQHRERLSGRVDIDAVLDLMVREALTLTPEIADDFPAFETYAQYIAAFEADHPAFYGVETRRHDNARKPTLQRDQAWEEIARLRGETEALQARIADLQQGYSAVVSSTAWRLTAPLRKLLSLGRRRD